MLVDMPKELCLQIYGLLGEELTERPIIAGDPCISVVTEDRPRRDFMLVSKQFKEEYEAETNVRVKIRFEFDTSYSAEMYQAVELVKWCFPAMWPAVKQAVLEWQWSEKFHSGISFTLGGYSG